MQNALASFGGTYLIVSHDRDFLDPIVDRVIELSDTGVRFFEGNLSDYVERIISEGKIVCASKPQTKVSDYKLRKKMLAQSRQEISRKKKELRLLEEKIALLEEESAKVEAEMSSPDFFKKGNQCASTTENYNALKKELQQCYEMWEFLSNELDSLGKE